MKIATITCHGFTNHGAALQAYALTRRLADMGHDVQMIRYLPPYLQFGLRQWYLPRSLRDFGALALRYNYRRDTIARHRRHLEFAERHLPLTRQTYTSSAQLAHEYEGADVLVAGSDQIWNPTFANGSDPAFYLDFAREGVRRISYAASFAVSEIPQDMRQQMTRRISALDAVSVREISALRILNDLGCSGTQVSDPVFLLDRADWQPIIDEGARAIKPPRRPYLLVYDFYLDEAMRQVACRAARLLGLDIISAGNMRLSYARRNCCGVGPDTFLALVAGARLVVSNSFHATAFSLLLGKDFLVVNRPDGLNDRMADITTHYGLGHRIVSPESADETLTTSIDYSEVMPLIEADREGSRRWLGSALGS